MKYLLALILLSGCTVNHYHYMANYVCDSKEELKIKLDSINSKMELKENKDVCKLCGGSLIDENTTDVLTSNPPKKRVKCSKCDFVDYKVMQIIREQY